MFPPSSTSLEASSDAAGPRLDEPVASSRRAGDVVMAESGIGIGIGSGSGGGGDGVTGVAGVGSVVGAGSGGIGDGAARPVAPPLLRTSCDNCSRKKNKCTGEMPCNRCARAGVLCTYSTKRKLGRPRTASRGGQGGGTSKRSRALVAKLNTDRPAFSMSPATGLAGLAESRFLSCFVEHFNPL